MFRNRPNRRRRILIGATVQRQPHFDRSRNLLHLLAEVAHARVFARWRAGGYLAEFRIDR
jgi:hypothetical protein